MSKRKILKFFIKLYNLTMGKCNSIIKKYNDSRISAYSGQSAFFMILSFFPFMLFFFSLLNLTPLSEADFYTWVFNIVPDAFEKITEDFVTEIYGGSATERTITIIMALWMSSKAFMSVQQGLDSVYHSTKRRNYFIMRFWAVIYSAVLAVLLIVTLALLVFGDAIHSQFFGNVPIIGDIVRHRMIISIPVLTFFFWLAYYILPSKKHRMRDQIPGAVFAATAWYVFSHFFSIYMNQYSNYASFYGAMTTIALIMVWLYGCMYVLFIGGFINSCLDERRHKE